ncbi:hypothetical protein JQ544_04200 [Bradyrhizobium diazoefficiens]|nr:hypothetical protein [Bradyrhizobium diazoefficiens]MBR0810711.1 hypothetical protein [Bradyrhizobium diazoefficiens]
MTNHRLRTRLIAAAILVVTILAVSFAEYFAKYPLNTTTFVGNNATLFALIFAAYLAFVFQQRGKFVDELRGWWNGIVKAKSDFFIYCEKSTPTEDDYLKGFYGLSTSMDTFRLIYCNVGRIGRNSKGYYPFEQVRDIIDISRSVHYSLKPTQDDRQKAKQAIDIVFQSLRHAIQSEAAAITPDAPTLHDSPYRSKYLEEIRLGVGVDIPMIRNRNKKEDYVSRRER